MQTALEAVGGNDVLRRLGDDVVAHTPSHGFHARHVERLAAYWAEALGVPTTYSDSLVARPPSLRCIAGLGGLPATVEVLVCAGKLT